MEKSDKNVNAEMELAGEFLKDANFLFDKGSIRSSCSRMYYAVFHASRAMLLKLGFNPKTHRGAIMLFGKEVIRRDLINEKYAKLVTKAFSIREQADYQPFITINAEELRNMLKVTENFIKDVKKSIKITD